VLLAWGGWRLLSPGTESNQPVPPPPVLNPPKPAAKPAPQPVVAPVQTAVPSPATDTVPPASATVEQQQASAMPPPAAGAKTPATSLSLPTRTATQSSAGAPAQPAVAVPAVGSGQVFGALNRNPRVVLRARGDARVTVRGPDGEILLNRDLKAGDIYQVPNIPGATMATSDAGAVDVDVDGIALGRAGQPQQVLGRVSLDPQSLTDRFNNR